MKTPRGASESSTTSDNTTEFIDIVKKYDVVYNTHNPDYKNVEVKMKVWSQIAEEIGLSVDASKRKWKNLRDSYTKYLRSFRIGTKTSKKYQYWAHAEHMDFLKPYQGPGRHSNGNSNSNSIKTNDDEDTECDFGFQVLTKATNSSSDEDMKPNLTTTTTTAVTTMPPNTTTPVHTLANTIPPVSVFTSCTTITTPTTVTSAPAICKQQQLSPNGINNFMCTAAAATIVSAATTTSASTGSGGGASGSLGGAGGSIGGGAIMLPLPSLPAVALPPVQPAPSKPLLGPISTLPTNMPPAQIFPLPPLPNAVKSSLMPANSTASSVGCLIIEPQLFASADTFKKELSAPTIGLFHSITSPATSTTTSSRVNPPLITKIRRVQPSPQTAAINLSFTATPATTTTAPTYNQPPPAKVRKTNDRERDRAEVDISAILQANRDLDANTLFFLSLARMVRCMPTKLQSLAKMRCMRIVSDIELELENVNECGGMPPQDDSHGGKFSSLDSSPSPPDGTTIMTGNPVSDAAPTEHFVYVMSPSRVESMIDISSDEEATMNGT